MQNAARSIFDLHSSNIIIPDGDDDLNWAAIPIEYLNTLTLTVLTHKLRLKRGCVLILIRNLNDVFRFSVFNGTRIIVDDILGNTLLKARTENGSHRGRTILLPIFGLMHRKMSSRSNRSGLNFLLGRIS